jgi:hypothetical protein
VNIICLSVLKVLFTRNRNACKQRPGHWAFRHLRYEMHVNSEQRPVYLNSCHSCTGVAVCPKHLPTASVLLLNIHVFALVARYTSPFYLISYLCCPHPCGLCLCGPQFKTLLCCLYMEIRRARVDGVLRNCFPAC